MYCITYMQQSFFTISFIWKAHWLELSLHAEHGLLVARVTDWCSDAAANELVTSTIMQCSSQKHQAVFHAGWIKLRRTQLEQMNDNVVPQCNEQTLAHICGWTSECHSRRTALIGSLSGSSHVHTLLWLRRDRSSGMNQSLSLSVFLRSSLRCCGSDGPSHIFRWRKAEKKDVERHIKQWRIYMFFLFVPIDIGNDLKTSNKIHCLFKHSLP